MRRAGTARSPASWASASATEPLEGADTFALATVHPLWRGSLRADLREPLLRGMAAVRESLGRAPIALCTLISDFDTDGLSERIADIASVVEPREAKAAAQAAGERAAAGLLRDRPTWRLLDGKAGSRSFMDRGFPAHDAGCKLGDGSGIDFAYVRIWAMARTDCDDPLAGLLATLPLEPEFVRFFLETGSE